MKKPPAKNLHRMRIPKDLWDVCIDKVPESVRNLAKNYIIRSSEIFDNSAGLILGGPLGVGKSGLAAYLGIELWKKEKTVLFSPIADLREDLKNRANFDESFTIFERSREVDVLIIDDLKETDVPDRIFGLQHLEELICYRGRNRKITIVTTRIPLKTFDQKYRDFIDAVQSYIAYVPITGPNQKKEVSVKINNLIEKLNGSR